MKEWIEMVINNLERRSPGDEDVGAGTANAVVLEGNLVRKHEWENTTTKASNRSWDKVYAVLRTQGQITFFKDSKQQQTHKGEPTMQLKGAIASVATDYKKKKHVFRLK